LELIPNTVYLVIFKWHHHSTFLKAFSLCLFNYYFEYVQLYDTWNFLLKSSRYKQDMELKKCSLSDKLHNTFTKNVRDSYQIQKVSKTFCLEHETSTFILVLQHMSSYVKYVCSSVKQKISKR
jgi:hypothetical protein